MKLTKSKKLLAYAIHASCRGWPDVANWAAQDKGGGVFYFSSKPTIGKGREVWDHHGCIGKGGFRADKIPNWHQTVLSREEYFSAYPAELAAKEELDALECRESVTRSIPELAAKPTIEQLAADYRNAKDYAERKQQEADAAKADAEAKLALLVEAGKAHGLSVSPITEKQEPELVITDWRDLRIGDEIMCIGGVWDPSCENKQRTVKNIERPSYVGSLCIEVDSCWGSGFRFIRRP